jgi:hypothetical protein
MRSDAFTHDLICLGKSALFHLARKLEAAKQKSEIEEKQEIS